MSINFGEILLYSQNPKRLAHFLSYIFDVTPQVESDIIFAINGVKFRIILCDNGQSIESTPSTIQFSFHVACISELDEIKKMLEFYYFKESLKPSINTVISNDTLFFVDPDKRFWKVSVSDIAHYTKQSTNTLQSNVRIC